MSSSSDRELSHIRNLIKAMKSGIKSKMRAVIQHGFNF